MPHRIELFTPTAPPRIHHTAPANPATPTLANSVTPTLTNPVIPANAPRHSRERGNLAATSTHPVTPAPPFRHTRACHGYLAVTSSKLSHPHQPL